MSADAELVKLFGSVLNLCAVKPGEVVAVLTAENGDRAAYASAYLAAAADLGAHALQINVGRSIAPANPLQKQTPLTGNVAAIHALKQADIVIDLIGLLWSAEQKEIQDAGARILMSREPVEVIRRMFPTKERRRRVEAAEKLLKKARKLRITSPAGTDVTYKLGKYPVITQYGFTDQPGRWDNLSAGAFLYTGGHDDGVDGTVVIAQGDIIFPFRRYMSAPIRLHIVAGRVEKIEGDGVDAALLREFMQRFNDPRAYAISHIGWGMDEKAQWEYLGTSPLSNASAGADGRAYCGNVLFSTGPNMELGGSNDTGCHLDIPLRGCDLYLDGEPVVKAGNLVPAELRA
jgi:2,5-dihydroxypyridine 5,6-dioxygenase